MDEATLVAAYGLDARRFRATAETLDRLCYRSHGERRRPHRLAPACDWPDDDRAELAAIAAASPLEALALDGDR